MRDAGVPCSRLKSRLFIPMFSPTLQNIDALQGSERWQLPSSVAGPKKASLSSAQKRGRHARKRISTVAPTDESTCPESRLLHFLRALAVFFLLLVVAVRVSSTRGRGGAHRGDEKHEKRQEEPQASDSEKWNPTTGHGRGSPGSLLVATESGGDHGNLTILRIPKTGSSEVWKHGRGDRLTKCKLVGHLPSLDSMYDGAHPSIAVGRDVCQRFRSQFIHLKYKVQKKMGVARRVGNVDEFARVMVKKYGAYKDDPTKMAAKMRVDQDKLGGGHWIILAPLAAYINENTTLIPYNRKAPERIMDICGDDGRYIQREEAEAQRRRDKVSKKKQKITAPLSDAACRLIRTQLFPIDDFLVNGTRT